MAQPGGISEMKPLNSFTLDASPIAEGAKRVMNAALKAADPFSAVGSILKRKGNVLVIGDDAIALEDIGKIVVIAFGKASAEMARSAQAVLGEDQTAGVLVCKYAPSTKLPKFITFIAGHPIPDERSLSAGKYILDLLHGLTRRDLVLFLISGGGSALVTYPVEGSSLADLRATTNSLLRCGASIDEINTLRRALDQAKGGGMALAAGYAKQYSLILSDVVNSPLAAIASGPTVPDPNQPGDALTIVHKYHLEDELPKSVLTALFSAKPKVGGNFGKTHIIGSNEISATRAGVDARAAGFECDVITTSFQGEAGMIGARMARTILKEERRPICLIAGGESTVDLGNNPGRGGRNLEVALAAVDILADTENVLFITLATDGDDGPTGAAGAVVDGNTKTRAEQLGMQAGTFITRHASYDFFNPLNDLLVTGPTGTNVNDLIFMFKW